MSAEPTRTTQHGAKAPLRAYGWVGVSTEAQARSEKESIPAQKRDVEAAAERLGVKLIDILVVPGFSRNYIDFPEMRDDMLRDGIEAPARLQRLWENKGLDLFICKDADRFGRTLPVLSTIAAHIVFTAGARIYVAAKGIMIDPDNYNMFVAMFGLMAADEVHRLQERYETGMRRRFEDGLPGTNPPLSHKIVFDGKTRRLVLDDDKAAFWADLADFFLSGLPYHDLAAAMAGRGHRSPRTGKAYNGMSLRRLLYNPYLWGHVAYRWHGQEGAWGYDDSQPLPPGTQVIRDSVPAVYEGELALKVQAELRRREAIIRGRTQPDGTHRFTGLFVCGDCGYHMVHVRDRYYCPTRWIVGREHVTCANTVRIRESTATAQIGLFLERWLNQPGSDLPRPKAENGGEIHGALEQLEKDAANLERRIRVLIAKQADAPLNVGPLYDEQIQAESARLEAIRERRLALLSRIESSAQRAQREQSREEIAELGVARFFAQSNTAINQMLHRLMGPARFVVDGGEIVDVRFPDQR